MIKTLKSISKVIPELKEYNNKCIATIKDIIKEFNNRYFWADICKTIYGYAKHEVDGWYTNFFRIEQKSSSLFPVHITKLEYTNIDDGQTYYLYCGILSSVIEDKCMVPSFNKVIAQRIS
jgi:hypothetical protein